MARERRSPTIGQCSAGGSFEPVARRLYEEKTGIRVSPAVVVSSEYSFLSASLDGLSDDDSVAVELKCPGKENHQKAIDGFVPDHYFAQVQHQLLVTGLKSIDYVSYDGQDSLAVVTVERDEEFLAKYLDRAKFFWECVQTGQCPVKEYFDIESLMLDYDDIRSKITMLEEKAEAVSKRVSEMVKEPMKVGRFSLSWSERKGSVDYSKVPNLDGVNLDLYRKPSTKYFSIRRCGK